MLIHHIRDKALQFAAWNHAALLLRCAKLDGLSGQGQAGQTRKDCDILLHKVSTIIFIFQTRDIAGSPLAKAQFPTAKLEDEIPKRRRRLWQANLFGGFGKRRGVEHTHRLADIRQ
jgi:hypothetical protein